MRTPITASMLYDLVRCPHRVAMDLFGDQADKDPISSFVELLWEKGNAFERELIESLAVPFVDLSGYAGDEKEQTTTEAIHRGEDLIYSGRIRADDLLGEPDLLRRQDNGYVAGDIKSGAGVEGAGKDRDRKPKKHYAVGLALYTDILERLGVSGGHRPFVWDVHREEVVYDLDAPQGPKTPQSLWDLYQSCLIEAQNIVARRKETLPALIADCKLCHWRSTCTRRLEQLDDLTLIPELGRAKRDSMRPHVASVRALANSDLRSLVVKGTKTIIAGVSLGTLEKFQARAELQTSKGARPYLREPLDLPEADLELFFDIEVDPMRDICYLHGFVERRGCDNGTEKYVAFLAEKPTPEEEKRAFAEAWKYVQNARSRVIYYYSAYERTWWRTLQQRYPNVAREEEIEEMFSPKMSVDLYLRVVRPATEWPTHNYSIKTLASFLGFEWRDQEPSGTAAVGWYHRWTETGDAGVRQRILDYNEDDCRATRVLLDGVRALEVR